jgi:non-ribosomal peptide synthetase component F
MTQLFNACEYLLDRRLAAGDGQRLALTGAAGELTYAQLHDRVCRTATRLRAIGLQPEQRVLMLMADTPDFVTVYLAAMRAGAIPVPVSTMLRADGVAELLTDSRARFLAVTREFSATAIAAAAAAPELAGILADHTVPEAPVPVHLLDGMQAGPFGENVYSTTADSPAFWLCTSGTTGRPKAAMHRHGAIPVVCETYGTQILGIQPGDRCLSSAKAFFAYGLGNSMLFPLSVGAASVPERALSTPEVIAAAAQNYDATLFFAGPTFFAGMLRAGLPPDALAGVRLGRRRAGKARRVRDPAARPVRRRSRPDRLLSPWAAVGQATPQGGIHRRLPNHRHRKGPPRRTAGASLRRPPLQRTAGRSNLILSTGRPGCGQTGNTSRNVQGCVRRPCYPYCMISPIRGDFTGFRVQAPSDTDQPVLARSSQYWRTD